MKCHRHLKLHGHHGGKHHGHHGGKHHGHHGHHDCAHRGFGPGFQGVGPCDQGPRGFGPGRHGFGPDHHSFGPGRKGGKGHGHHGKWGKGHHGHKRDWRFNIGFEGLGQTCGSEQRYENVGRAELISIIEALAFRTPTPSSPQPETTPAAETEVSTPGQANEQGK